MKNTNVILYLFASLCWLAASIFVFMQKNIKVGILGILYIVLALMNLALAHITKRKMNNSTDLDNSKQK